MKTQAPPRPPVEALPAPTPVPMKGAKDRCDNARCGAQARVRVTMQYGFIDFCAHHYQANMDHLQWVPSIVHTEDRRSEIS